MLVSTCFFSSEPTTFERVCNLFLKFNRRNRACSFTSRFISPMVYVVGSSFVGKGSPLKFDFTMIFTIFFIHMVSVCWQPKVEKSHECQEILECRMRDGMIPQGRLVSDVCGYTPDAETQRLATALTGGFPCQVHNLDNFI